MKTARILFINELPQYLELLKSSYKDGDIPAIQKPDAGFQGRYDLIEYESKNHAGDKGTPLYTFTKKYFENPAEENFWYRELLKDGFMYGSRTSGPQPLHIFNNTQTMFGILCEQDKGVRSVQFNGHILGANNQFCLEGKTTRTNQVPDFLSRASYVFAAEPSLVSMSLAIAPGSQKANLHLTAWSNEVMEETQRSGKCLAGNSWAKDMCKLMEFIYKTRTKSK